MSSIKKSEGNRRGSGHNEASMDLQQPSSKFLSAMVLPGKSSRNDFPIEWHRAALLIIDIQDFLSSPAFTSSSTTTDEEGRRVDETCKRYLFQESLPSAMKNIEVLLSSFRQVRQQKQGEGRGGGQSGKPEIIFTYLEALTEDYREISLDYKLSGPSLSTMLPTPSKPAVFLPRVSPLINEIRMPKSSCSVFLSTNIKYILRNLNVEQLVLCGQITNQCVESACRDAADLGYFVTVVQDACAAYSLKDHQLGLSNMKGFARIVTTEQVVEELLSSSSSKSLSVIASARQTFSSVETKKALDEKNVQHVPTDATTAETHNIKPIFSASTVTKPVVHDVTATQLPIKSILLALRAAQVQFLRYAALDCANGIRCKAAPLKRLISNPETLNAQVCVAEVCFAGMPGFGDMILKDSGLSARNVLVLRPDLKSLRVLPYSPSSALALCTLHDQVTGSLSPLCTRTLLQRVIDTALGKLGISFSVGAELEFVLAREGVNFEPVDHSVFANMVTLDEQESFILTLYQWLDMLDIQVTQIHAESAPGQLEVVLAHQDDALRIADHIVLAKETVCACAKSHGLRAIFLPKVFPYQAGNGLHLHFSFRHGVSSQNAFIDQSRHHGISQLGESFMEGILAHLPALTSLTIPSTNSFRRIGQGCWTGSTVAWSLEDKEVPLRVCIDASYGYPTNVEYKLCDASCNIYLALACVLGCGADGISRKLILRPMDGTNIGKASGVETVQELLCADFQSALACLQKDTFLLDLLGEKLSKGYVAVKEAEIEHSKDLSLAQELDALMAK